MSFLFLNGTTISVADGGASVKWTEIGDRTRAFDGTMRASIIARKRVWSVKTVPLIQSDADTLRTILTGTPIITLSGDWVEGLSIQVWPMLGQETIGQSTTLTWIFDFTLQEI